MPHTCCSHVRYKEPRAKVPSAGNTVLGCNRTGVQYRVKGRLVRLSLRPSLHIKWHQSNFVHPPAAMYGSGARWHSLVAPCNAADTAPRFAHTYATLGAAAAVPCRSDTGCSPSPPHHASSARASIPPAALSQPAVSRTSPHNTLPRRRGQHSRTLLVLPKQPFAT